MIWFMVCGNLGVLAVAFATMVRGVFKSAFLAAGVALLYPVVAHDAHILLSLIVRRG